MGRVKLIVAAAALAITASCASPSYRDQSVAIDAVDRVDLDRYAGLWYEIARYPNRFEEGCVGVTAEYSRRPDGMISVTNTCHRPGEPKEVADGRARVVDGSNGAKLKVSFAPAWIPFAWGDYWVLALDDDYRTALVGDPSGRYLWILAREPEISDARYQAMTEAAREDGFDPTKLERTAQPPPQ